MLANLVFLLIISSGGVIGATKYNKKYEEMMPITCSLMVVILFLFGVWGQLKMGVIAIIVIAIYIYILSIFIILKERKLREFINCFFSSGFCIFSIFIILFFYLDKGLLVRSWDEFSHWADIVKAMTYIDDFGTSPLSHSLFQSYPPGMSLFQYFFQKINMLCKGTNAFSEWRIYFAYQVFLISIYLPLTKYILYKKPVVALISIMAIFLTPMAFFEVVYSSTYIDPILGVLSGIGLSMIFLWKEKDVFYSIDVLLTCSMLVLMKDVGIVFSFLLAIVYVVDYFNRKRENSTNVNAYKKSLKEAGVFVISICAVIMPKILWAYKVNISGANKTFSDKLDFIKLFSILLSKEKSYQNHVIQYYWGAFIGEKPYYITNLGFSISYLTLLLFFVALLICICKIYCQTANYSRG